MSDRSPATVGGVVSQRRACAAMARPGSLALCAASVAAAAGLALTTPALAQIRWNSSTGGNWSDASKWTPNNVPDTLTESAVIDAAGFYTVVVSNSYNIASLSIPSVIPQLHVASSNTFGIGSGGIANSGQILLNPTAGISPAALRLANGSATVSQSGSIILNASASNLNSASIGANSANWILTQTLDHTIRGTGIIAVGLNNSGRVIADRAGRILTITSAPQFNNGLFTTSGEGILDISTAFTNGPNGRIEANTGTVQFNNAFVTGGLIRAFNAGTCRIAVTSTFANLTIAGPFTVGDGQDFNISGTSLINNGTITVPTDGPSIGGRVMPFNGPAALNGTGSVVLNAPAGSPTFAAIASASNAWTLTQAPTHTIRGTGVISAPFINNGSIIADRANTALRLEAGPHTNNTLMSATSNGVLEVRTTVNQSLTGEIVANGGSVWFANAAISGGQIRSSQSRKVSVTDTSTFDNVTFSGIWNVNPNVEARIGPNGIVNNGDCYIDGTPFQSPALASLTLAAGSAAILGSGRTILFAFPGINFESAALRSLDNSWTLTIGPQQTLAGNGRIFVKTVLQGRLLPGVPDFSGNPDTIGRFEVRAPFTFDSTSTTTMQLGTPTSSETITSDSPMIINGGTLIVLNAGIFTPALGQSWPIITASSITGQFANVQFSSPIPPGLKWALDQTPTALIVRVTCIADFNNDGTVDFFDYLDFVAAFDAEAPQADFNGDAVVDFFDYLDFVAAFDASCP